MGLNERKIIAIISTIAICMQLLCINTQIINAANRDEVSHSDYINELINAEREINEVEIKINELDNCAKNNIDCDELQNLNKLLKNYKNEMSANYQNCLDRNDGIILRAGVTNSLHELSYKYYFTNIQQIYEKAISLKLNTYNRFCGISQERIAFCKLAESYKGQIPYVWGGKPINKEYNAKERGLDCSGFIEYIYWNSFDEYNEDVNSTGGICNSQTQITYSELLPGDLGLIRADSLGSYYIVLGKIFYSQAEVEGFVSRNGLSLNDITTVSNHVGIYLGKDNNGNDLWCHCRGGEWNTVVIDNYDGFTVYFRLDNFTEHSDGHLH